MIDIFLEIIHGGKMKKESITLFAKNEEEAQHIRSKFQQDECDKQYRLNIIISGYEDTILSLSQFLLAKMK